MNNTLGGEFNAQRDTTWTSEWGGGTLPKSQHGSAVIIPGDPQHLDIHPGGQWDTFYQLRRLGAQNNATMCAYHIAFQFPDDAHLALAQAVEFEIQRNDGLHILNGGVQFDIRKTKMVRTYDFTAGQWVSTPIAYDPSWLAHSAILDVVAVYDLAPSSITFRGLLINKQWYPLGITRPAVSKVQTPHFNFAYQLDCTSVVAPNLMWIPECDIVIL